MSELVFLLDVEGDGGLCRRLEFPGLRVGAMTEEDYGNDESIQRSN